MVCEQAPEDEIMVLLSRAHLGTGRFHTIHDTRIDTPRRHTTGATLASWPVRVSRVRISRTQIQIPTHIFRVLPLDQKAHYHSHNLRGPSTSAQQTCLPNTIVGNFALQQDTRQVVTVDTWWCCLFCLWTLVQRANQPNRRNRQRS